MKCLDKVDVLEALMLNLNDMLEGVTLNLDDVLENVMHKSSITKISTSCDWSRAKLMLSLKLDLDLDEVIDRNGPCQ